MRVLRMLRELSLPQVVSRIRLRARMAARRAWPPSATTQPGGGAAPRGSPFVTPRALARPCPPSVSASIALDAARGRYTFAGVSRDLSPSPFPPPADVPLLWAYELEYMEYLYDLALSGEHEVVMRLVAARAATDARPGRAGRHPYTEARRVASVLRAMSAMPRELRGPLASFALAGARRLARNLETDVGGNHLLENGLALVLAGACLAGRETGEMLRRGEAILLAGARDQILSDGGHYELSPMYHARVLAVLLEGGLALSASGRPPPGRYFRAVASMCSLLAGIVGPAGELPLLGDCGRDARVDPAWLLDAAASLLPVPIDPPGTTDRLWADSGFAVFTDRARGDRLLLDAGPVCPPRLPAHGQADTFTFELMVGGVEMVVDPGVMAYESGPAREWSRSTRAHSTVEIEGEDSSEVYGSFRVGRRARVVGLAWRRDGAFGSLRAEHDGYRHRGAVHRRLVSHLAPGLFLVADTVRSRRPVGSRSRLHLAPGAIVAVDVRGSLDVSVGAARLRAAVLPGASVDFEAGTHSPSFGDERPTRIAVQSAAGRRAAFAWCLSCGDHAPARLSLRDDVVVVRSGGREWARALP